MKFPIFLVYVLTAYCCKAYEVGDEFLFKYGDITRSTIRRSIRRIPDINIQLVSKSNAENNYIKFFLYQKTTPISISYYKIEDSTKIYNRENYVVACNMDNLKAVANKFAKRAGLFFFVILDAIDREAFTNIFRELWRRDYVFRIYLLTVIGIFLFDPFSHDQFGNYGQIVNVEARNLTTIFQDMNGYPLRIQIFRSVYSKVFLDSDNNVLKATGADSKVAYLLAEKMNYTMNLQLPEPDVFG